MDVKLPTLIKSLNIMDVIFSGFTVFTIWKWFLIYIYNGACACMLQYIVYSVYKPRDTPAVLNIQCYH